MARTITSADSSFAISSADFALAATLLQGYAADASFAMGAQQTVEASLGVDGKTSFGWVPRNYEQTITLQADSPSIDIINGIVLAQDAARAVYRLNAAITLPGQGKSYILSNGAITQHQAMPDAARTLQPQTFTITWSSVKEVPLA